MGKKTEPCTGDTTIEVTIKTAGEWRNLLKRFNCFGYNSLTARVRLNTRRDGLNFSRWNSPEQFPFTCVIDNTYSEETGEVFFDIHYSEHVTKFRYKG